MPEESMSEKIGNFVAALVMVVALLLGIIGYAGKKSPEEPIRIAYDNKGGLVVFDHREHAKGISCDTCHHYYEGEGRPHGCRSCHNENDIPIMDAFHRINEDYEGMGYTSCVTCHEESGKNPKNCRGCHK